MKRLRQWWNWHFDLPKLRGGNLSFIPLEVRDTSHPSYMAWASFLRIAADVHAGPRATLVAWSGYLQAWNYHRNLDEDA